MVRQDTHRTIKFYKYYDQWIHTYKHGSVKQVTFDKYVLTCKQIKHLAPNLRLSDVSRTDVQKLISDYGKTHEKQTTLDFYHLLEASLRDAVYEGWLERDPCHRIQINAKTISQKPKKWLEVEDAHKLDQLFHQDKIGYGDWFDILLRTGMRFAELLGITPKDVHVENMQLSINKTMNYKTSPNAKMKYGAWMPTKNPSSVRTISIDYQTLQDFQKHMVNCPQDESIVQNWNDNRHHDRPAFFRYQKEKHRHIANSTFNHVLFKMCAEAGVNRITIHGLRHTHASLLIANHVSIQSVAERLGHANTETTQRVYIHLLNDLKQQDKAKIMNVMSII